MRRAAARLTTLALIAAASLAGILTAASPAQAATFVRECKGYNISCITFSGYAGKSVWGFPVSASGNNCVNYAAYRLSRNGVATVSGLGNGGSWAGNARAKGFRVDRTATTGSIAQWNYGSTYAPTHGHVGYVEEVTSSYIVVSDSAWSGYSSRMKITRGDRNWPSNFIHFKDRPYTPPPSGSFLKVRETGEVYRLVGKAPVFVSTWTAFGGAKATYAVSSTAFASLPLRPANGTFIKGAQRGEVYRILGGAPVYVSTWTTFGGTKPTTTVDQVAIDRAGSSARYAHLRFRPVDGTVLYARMTGKRYRVTAGAPAPTTATSGGWMTDATAVARAGSTSAIRWTHLAKPSSP